MRFTPNRTDVQDVGFSCWPLHILKHQLEIQPAINVLSSIEDRVAQVGHEKLFASSHGETLCPYQRHDHSTKTIRIWKKCVWPLVRALQCMSFRMGLRLRLRVGLFETRLYSMTLRCPIRGVMTYEYIRLRRVNREHWQPLEEVKQS